MKNINKYTLPVAAMALVAAGAVGTFALQSYAQTATTDAATTQSSSTTREGGNPISSLIKAIASKFNLSESDVQSVFDDQRTQMESQHKQMEQARLSQAVTDGKLTQAQADAITAKQAEMQADREANKDSFGSKTEAERKTEMEAKKADLEQWATDNNIPKEFMPFGGGRTPGGPGGHGGFKGQTPDATTTAQ